MSHYGRNEKPHRHQLSDTGNKMIENLTGSSHLCLEKWTDGRNMTPDWMELDCCVLLYLQRLEKIWSRFNLGIFKAFYLDMSALFLALLNIYTVMPES